MDSSIQTVAFPSEPDPRLTKINRKILELTSKAKRAREIYDEEMMVMADTLEEHQQKMRALFNSLKLDIELGSLRIERIGILSGYE